MTFQETRDEVETVLGGMPTGLYRDMGEALLGDLDAELKNYTGSGAVSETDEYITWSTVTMPAYIADLKSLADTYDGQGTGPDPVGWNLQKSFLSAQERIKAITQRESTPRSAYRLLYRAVNMESPNRPRQFDAPTNFAASKLSKLIEEAEAWLAFVGT